MVSRAAVPTETTGLELPGSHSIGLLACNSNKELALRAGGISVSIVLPILAGWNTIAILELMAKK
jgi:hypothetical protein